MSSSPFFAPAIVEAVMCGDVAACVASPRARRSLTRTGRAPADARVLNGHRDVVEYLIEKGASVDELDKIGNTALINASAKGTRPW